MLPRLLFASLLSATLVPAAAFADKVEPERDVKYDTKHERNLLDFFPPLKKAERPAPVLIWFHGGGFRNGDKSQLEKHRSTALQSYRQSGYAVASCNYPFLTREIDYLDIGKHCARAVQFIRSKASDWDIDPERIACGGVSAGALISEYVAYFDDFADPGAEDLVSRQSSRPAVVVSIMQPRGTEAFVLGLMDKGEAPIFLYSNASPTDTVHPPAAAIMMRDRAKELGIPCAAYGGGRNKLPEPPGGKNWLELQIAFCEKHLH